MRKLLLGFSLFLCCSYPALAKRIITVQCGAGPNGYKTVWEQHVSDYHALNCEDPGDGACVWKTPPPQQASLSTEEAQYVVQAKIAEGLYEGTVDYDDCTLTWTAQSATCYTYAIDY